MVALALLHLFTFVAHSRDCMVRPDLRDDSRECDAELTLTFGTKDLLLHGPLGAGIDLTKKLELTEMRMNDGVYGPTMFLRKGDHVNLKYTNEINSFALLNQEAEQCGHNTLCHIQFTNIHTHGCWIDPQNTTSGMHDYVLNSIDSDGGYQKYTYLIPEDHPSGTFWYHPHRHGATALQTGGGAAGNIVVLDEMDDFRKKCKVPGKVCLAEIPVESDLELFFQATSVGDEHDFPNMAGDSIKPEIKDQLEQELNDIVRVVNPIPIKTDPTEYLIMWVNGEINPIFRIKQNQATRLRFTGSSYHHVIQFDVVDLGENMATGCTSKQIANDGVYFDSPRDLSSSQERLVMIPGARADLIIECENTGVLQITSHIKPRANDEIGEIGDDSIEVNYPLFQIIVEPCSKGCMPWDEDLPKHPDFLSQFEVLSKHAQYPRKERSLNSDTYKKWANLMAELGMPVRHVTMDIVVDRTDNKYAVNGISWPEEPASFIDFDTGRHAEGLFGTTEIWVLHGGQLSDHPFHIHVNHFLLLQYVVESEGEEIPPETAGKFLVGQWYDTLTVPKNGYVIIALPFLLFSGDYVFHCHFLDHEDKGMMSFLPVKKKYEHFDSYPWHCSTLQKTLGIEFETDQCTDVLFPQKYTLVKESWGYKHECKPAVLIEPTSEDQFCKLKDLSSMFVHLSNDATTCPLDRGLLLVKNTEWTCDEGKTLQLYEALRQNNQISLLSVVAALSLIVLVLIGYRRKRVYTIIHEDEKVEEI